MPTFLEHADSGRHAFWRYLVTVILIFAVQTLAILVYAGVLIARGMDPLDLQTTLLDPSQPMIFYGMIAISFAATLLGTVAAVAWLHRKSPAALLGDWSWGLFAAGFAIWLIVLILNTATTYALRPQDFVFEMQPAAASVVLLVLAALAIQTFAEEYVFRGYVTQGLLKVTRRIWVTSVVSGLIFGAFHIPNGIPQAISATLMGVAFAWISIRTGNIAFAWGVHLINNLYGALIVVAGFDVFKGSPALIRQTAPDPWGLDFAFVVVALGLIMLMLSRHKAAPRTPG